MSEKMKCRIVSWGEVYSMCKELAGAVERSGFEPKTIIALARSGFVPGRLLSDLLGIPDLVSLKVEHWLDTTGQHREEATIPYQIPFNVEKRRVLVVDDIVDTGKSMKVSVDYIERFKPEMLKTAVMQYITASIFKPDYYVTTVSDWVWFIYPWNFTEDLCNLTARILKANPSKTHSSQEVFEGFKESFGLEVPLEELETILRTLEKRQRAEGVMVKGARGWRISTNG